MGMAVSCVESPPPLSRFLDPEEALVRQRAGCAKILEYIREHPGIFRDMSKQDGSVLPKKHREEVVRTWAAFSDYLYALEETAETHRQFYTLSGEERQRAFYLHLASFLASYRFSMDFIEEVEKDPGLERLLNELNTGVGVPSDSYAKLKADYLNPGIASQFAALQVLSRTAVSDPAPVLKPGIQEDQSRIWAMGAGNGPKMTAQNALDIVKDMGSDAVFPAQAGVAEWMGTVRVWRPGVALISPEQIHSMRNEMEPGDLLLERREWFLTNAGIPGYWPHAAIFIGTAEERDLYFADAEVFQWVKEQGEMSGRFDDLLQQRFPENYAMSMRAEMGHPRRVVESIAQGVSFTSFEHSAAADSIAVLRPRLSKVEKAIALLRAFEYAGRPYDYDFDFLTDSALVCTELVYKAYQPGPDRKGLQLPLNTVAGRLVMPANEIAKLFSEEWQAPHQQFDLVLFLDGDEGGKRAQASDVATFQESWKRPKWHIISREFSEGSPISINLNSLVKP
jgi:hypothetical protein